jgi:hypothetical protein
MQALAPVTIEYFPAGQFTHTTEELAPTAIEDVPEGQLVHTTEELAPETPEYVPAMQLVHAAEELAPAVIEYAPAGHATQAVELLAPATDEYAPAGQDVHTAEELAPETPEYVPTAQLVHAAEELAPAVLEYFPAGHCTHALGPVAVLYSPGAHAVQVPPFGPVYPASQVQLLRNPLDAGAREFAGHRLQFGLPSGDHSPSGHARHVSLPVAPAVAEYSPSEQLEHAVRPSWLLYVPGSQSLHVDMPATCAYPVLQ